MGLARPRGDRGPVARRLIVNADDLGRSAGVDRGIVRAHREGIVTSATLMANTTDAAHAGAVARADPSLDVGVHLVLTFARPLSEPTRVRSLVTPTGEFPRRSLLLTREVDRDEALLEYRAQYARARELIGREPTHLDSHHWVHDMPALECRDPRDSPRANVSGARSAATRSTALRSRCGATSIPTRTRARSAWPGRRSPSPRATGWTSSNTTRAPTTTLSRGGPRTATRARRDRRWCGTRCAVPTTGDRSGASR